MSKFEPLGALVQTKFLQPNRDYVSRPWIRWFNLIAPRLTSPVTDDIPTSSTADGIQGEIRQDDNFIYICTDTNTWKRVAISSF